ncbi:MAG: UvrD-helicase domain-containing protein [Eubacteriales bacterium]|nr:UvrD-helicase domain-containing protein [Eubacteriales bacterium]
MKSFEEKYIEARKAFIEADFARLNPAQRQAVLTTEGPLLLLAGAGSGKTTVLIHRVANLLRYGRGSDCDYVPEDATEEQLEMLQRDPRVLSREERTRLRALAAVDPVEPWRILAITFTNKAAGELRSRLESMLGPEAGDIWAQTFHSACVRILRRDAEKLGFPASFTIYDTSDSLSAMKRVLSELNLNEKEFPPKAVLSAVSRAKDSMLSPEDFLAAARSSCDLRRIHIGEAYAAYAQRLFRAGAMDFDDLIYYTVRLLREHDEVRTFYQRKFRYILVDEYQDTSHLQYLLVSLLTGEERNICVVGDDDQSIYRFRGATIENILSFETEYKDARVIRLEQNYRSTGHILAAANAVISHNMGRKGKTLWTKDEDGSLPYMYTANSENDEAYFVARRILQAHDQGAPWRDHVVLYRMNAQSRPFEAAFRTAGVPYRIIGGTRFFDRAEVKDMLSYLCVLVNPEDDIRLLRIVNVPTRGIGNASLERAREIAERNELSLYEVMRRANEYPELSRAALRMRQFTGMMDGLREELGRLPVDTIYDMLLEQTGYIRALEVKNTDEDAARIENVRELKSSILDYMKTTGDDGLHGFLDEVALYTDVDNLDRDADCVVLMTMHAAKGLEFPTVFLVGAEEGIFPGIQSIGDAEAMEEERRLCYVAITRAMKRLYITCSAQRMLFGRTSSNQPSRFLDEIPPEHLERAAAYGRQPEGLYSPYSSPSTDGGYRTKTVPAPPRRIVPAAKPAAGTAAPAGANFSVGDQVEHRAFGRGQIVKMTPMGGDALIEVEFADKGTKRLMLRAATQYMKKV